MTPHAAVFLSKGAGALADADAQRAEERLAAALRSSGYDPAVVRLGGGEIENAARRAADDGADVVIVCGGDGSVAAAASALVGRSTPLAILPMGTRNHFARDLALPLDGEEAARALRQSAVRAVDVGEVNGRVFINNASMGAYPRLVELRTQDEAHNGASRLAATVRAGWRVMRRPPTLHVRLATDEADETLSTNLIFVGNNAYETTLPELGRRPSLTAGELAVVYATSTSRSAMLAGFVHTLSRGANNSAALSEVRAAAVTVTTRHRRVNVALDGEVVCLRPPLRFVSRPGALRLLVPAEGSGDGDP